MASVAVSVGQQVTAGQTLGTLDATALNESVSSAQSTVNADTAKLAEDEAAQTSTASSAAQSRSSSSTTTTPTTTSSATITADQATLTQDEAKVSSDQQQGAADLTQAQHACGTSGGASTSTTTSTTTPSGTATCEADLTAVAKDQEQVSTDEAQVAKDEAELSQALGQGSGAGGSGAGSGSGSSSPPQTPQAVVSGAATTTGNTGVGVTTSASSSTAGGSGAGSSSASDSPEQIATDQANIDTAEATLTREQQSLNEATLSSPINGTVVSVGITTGETVSADSSTEVIVIIGTASYEATGTLSSSQVPSVKVDDTAVVQVDGVDGTIDGIVSQVGPVQSGSSGYSYPVVVALPVSATDLFTGSTADVVIATGAVADVVAVPTSAVQTLGTRAFVETVSSGQLVRKMVKVGMIGDTYTQVESGLSVGQTVVLADYAEPVPSSNTSGVGGFGGGLGGLGGTGGFGGLGGGTGFTRSGGGGRFAGG